MLHLPYSLVAILAGIALAFAFPAIGFSLAPYALLLLALLNVISFSRVDVRRLFKASASKSKLVKNLFLDFVLSSFIAFVLGSLLPREQALALFLVSVMPTAAISVILTQAFRGEADEELSLTLLSFTLAPIIAPALLLFYFKAYVSFDAVKMFLTLASVIIIPLVLSRILRRFSVANGLKYDQLFNSAIFVLLLALTWGVTSSGVPYTNLVPFLGLFFVIAVFYTALMAFFGAALGSFSGEKIAFALAASVKSTATGAAIAAAFFSPNIVGLVVLYGVINHLLLIPLYLWVDRGK